MYEHSGEEGGGFVVPINITREQVYLSMPMEEFMPDYGEFAILPEAYVLRDIVNN